MTDVSINFGTINGPYHDGEEDNQDAYYFLQENGYSVIAVADGAGSLKNSKVGANIAVTTAVNEIMDSLSCGDIMEGAVRKGVESAREALLQRDDYKDLGCTLAVAALADDEYSIGIVGDAFAVVSLSDKDHIFYQPESDAEYANVTELLTSKKYTPLYYSSSDDIPAAITVSSDGLLNSTISKNEPTSGFWNPVISRCLDDSMDIQSFLYYMQDNEKIVDDTTLVVASRGTI